MILNLSEIYKDIMKIIYKLILVFALIASTFTFDNLVNGKASP